MTELIVAVCGVCIAFVTLIFSIWKLRRDDWKEIDRKFLAQEISLAAFKVEVAHQYPTVEELARLEKILLEAINNLTGRIDRLLERDVK